MALVIDNFITNPLETREYALSLPFTTYGNYPGKRTLGYAQESWIPYLEKYLPSDEKITWFDTHPFSYNGSFQVCGKSDGNSWIHRDTTDWAAVLFLTPDAPIDSGLTLYRHKRTKALGMQSVGGDEAENEVADLDAWEIDCTIGNVFNRLVMFRGDKFHKASVYFGNSSETSRLFQLHFFNTRSPPLHRWNVLSLPKVVVIIMSTNRYDYLEKTLQSLREKVSFDGCELADILVIDDYPLKRNTEKMLDLTTTYGPLTVLEHTTNEGLPETWRHAWDIIKSTKSYEWIFHLEDDIEFQRPLSIKHDLIDTYTSAEIPLSQLALSRQACYDPSIDVFTHLRDGTHGTQMKKFVTQERYFITMASLYPRDIVDKFPSASLTHQEHTVADFYAPKLVGGVLGSRHDPPYIHHLGQVSRGQKGPGFDHLPVDEDYDYKSGVALDPHVISHKILGDEH